MNLKDLYDKKYENEEVSIPILKPNGMHTNAYDDIARLVNETINVNSDPVLLDVGCGSGKLTFALSSIFNQLVGFDLSSVRIAAANKIVNERKEFVKKSIQFKCGDADEPFPFEDNIFDVVVACAILEHVIDPFRMIREMRRVTKTGGYVIISVPNIAYIKHVYHLLLGRVPLTGIGNHDMNEWERDGWDGAHLHYFTKKSLSSFLNHNKFRPIKWTGDGRYAPLRRWNQLFVGGLTVIAQKT